MIYIMTAQTFHDLVEQDEKAMNRSVIYRFNSTYILRDNTELVRSMNEIIPPYNMDENDYFHFLANNENAIKFRLMMAHELFSGMNVVVLIYPGSDSLLRLWLYFDFFKDVYGVVTHMIFDNTDFESIPKDHDDFSITGLFNYKQDQNKITEYLRAVITESDTNKKIALTQFRKSEVLL